MSQSANDDVAISIISLSRSSAWESKWLSWDVVLNGRKVATLRDGAGVSLRAEPGVHELRVLNGERHPSNTLRFEIEAGATLEAQGSEPQGRTQRAGPLGRFKPVLGWERQSGGVRIISE